jgi:hypothetical protein
MCLSLYKIFWIVSVLLQNKEGFWLIDLEQNCKEQYKVYSFGVKF